MQWIKPSTAKLPYSPFKKWAASMFAKKIRAALGMRVDEDGVNTTYRKVYKVANGQDVPANKNICHHFEQDHFGAAAVRVSTNYGRALVIDVPSDTNDNAVVMEIRRGNKRTYIRADGTIDRATL